MNHEISEVEFNRFSSLWGVVYEILVKRGTLAALAHYKLIHRSSSDIKDWSSMTLASVEADVHKTLGVTGRVQSDVGRTIRYLAKTAFALGYVVTREYIESHPDIKKGKLQAKAIWCPLTLPSEAHNDNKNDKLALFHEVFKLQGTPQDILCDRGQPVNADFILWLTSDHPKIKDQFLIQEYSFDASMDILNYGSQYSQLDDLNRYASKMAKRGAFSSITAEIDRNIPMVSGDIVKHINAMTHKDKPLYKLYQANSYGDRLIEALRKYANYSCDAMVRSMAITPNGIETQSGDYLACEKTLTQSFMSDMGEVYRKKEKNDYTSGELNQKIGKISSDIINRLPKALKTEFKRLQGAKLEVSQPYTLEFREDVQSFHRPHDVYAFQEALDMVHTTQALDDFFSEDTRQVMKSNIQLRLNQEKMVTLRDIHASAVIAGMQCTKKGEVSILALEGNPGIGKTTAVRQWLNTQKEGFLFLYLSPRVVINQDVASGVKKNSHSFSITSDSKLINAASAWYKGKANEGEDGFFSDRYIEGAAVVHALDGIKRPEKSILVLTSEQEREIEDFAGNRSRKAKVSESRDVITDVSNLGVLRCMTKVTHDILEMNQDVNQVTMVAAIQTLKNLASGSTVKALSKLFDHQSFSDQGIVERLKFAKRIQNVVIMVDEITGDGAGAPLVHELIQWVNNEFIDPFDSQPLFRVTLVLADASLVNKDVFDKFFTLSRNRDNAFEEPDRILISPSGGQRAFDMVASRSTMFGGAPTLHVMTNSYPAQSLDLSYKIRLENISIAQNQKKKATRQMIQERMKNRHLENAIREIYDALNKGAVQIIFFVQDRESLKDIKKQLTKDGIHDVKIIDSKITNSDRQDVLVSAKTTDIRVFLCTSSSARGISFPHCDWIIASMPRFNIESSLMELTQLIYRGRGSYIDQNGCEKSGDNTHRHLVFLIEEFTIFDEGEEYIDERQWLYRSMDLITMLLMLRSSVFTRITGDSNLSQKISFVPVGGIHVEDMADTTMSKDIATLIKEVSKEFRKIPDIEIEDKINAPATNAIEECYKIFSEYTLTGILKDRETRSIAQYDFMLDYAQATATPNAKLWVDFHIPNNIYVSGSAFVERVERAKKIESFRIKEDTEKLKKILAFFAHTETKINRDIKHAAKSILTFIEREGVMPPTLDIEKTFQSLNFWIVIPIAYLLFDEDENNGAHDSIGDDWKGSLAECVFIPKNQCAPLIPVYKTPFPWIAIHSNRVDPLKLDIAFDDRYFMASNEFNVLNTLLLADSNI